MDVLKMISTQVEQTQAKQSIKINIGDKAHTPVTHTQRPIFTEVMTLGTLKNSNFDFQKGKSEPI